jgi:hypothetical protein
LILLLVAFGLVNICLGFGLAIYFEVGPPGLDGIFEALGPMPPGAASPQPLVSGGLGAPYDPFATAEPSADSPAGIAEEQVLGDVRELADSAQTALAGAAVKK